jgi:hypothetical protein
MLFQLGAGTALAGKQDEAWAVCLWKQVPTSTQNWLSLTSPKKPKSMDKEDRFTLLKVRLEAACSKDLTPAGEKSPPSFKVEAIRAALAQIKPESVGPDLISPSVIRCEIFEEDILVASVMGVGNPEDIRLRPPATSKHCQRVRDDGSLVDA